MSMSDSAKESNLELVNFINANSDYQTTSYCTGRALLYTTSFEVTADDKKSKKDYKRLYTCHDNIDVDEFLSKVDPSEGDLIFKLEPFTLHVLCSNLEKGRALLSVAMSAGYRDSGIIINDNGEVTVSITGSLRLEVPISQSSVMLVSEIYLKYLMEVANEKMKASKRRVDQFFAILKDYFEKRPSTSRAVPRRPLPQPTDKN